MKTVIYIFILLFICLLIRSICIEIREYYYTPLIKELFTASIDCDPKAVLTMTNQDPKKFHEYIQQKMKDYNLKETENSLNSYQFIGTKRYQLKKNDNGQYINEPLTTIIDDEFKKIINLDKKLIKIKVESIGIGEKDTINLYGCNFIRNSDNDTIEQLSDFPILADKLSILIDSRIGGLQMAVGNYLNLLSGKTYNQKVLDNGLNSFQEFKYNKTYTILYENKKINTLKNIIGDKHPKNKKIKQTLNLSIYNIVRSISFMNKELIKEKGKNDKSDDKINKIENDIRILEEKYKLVYSKFKEDTNQYDMQESDYVEYITDNKEKNKSDKKREITKLLKKIYYMGIYTDLPYECRTTHIGNRPLSLFLVQPKNTKDKYLLSYKLVEDPKNPPPNSHVIIATKQ